MTEVTRSMEATGAATAAAVERERRGLPSGWWGMALLIATEATLFGLMLASYYYLRFNSPEWPPPGIEKPKVVLPLVMTGWLIATTVPLFMAVKASRLARAGLTWWLVLLAFVFQAGYLGIQVWQWLEDLHKLNPGAEDGTAYASIYLTILFAHHAHVAIGLGLDLWLLYKLLGGMTNYRLIGIRVITLYWYFVAAVAVPVVFTQIYPSL